MIKAFSLAIKSVNLEEVRFSESIKPHDLSAFLTKIIKRKGSIVAYGPFDDFQECLSDTHPSQNLLKLIISVTLKGEEMGRYEVCVDYIDSNAELCFMRVDFQFEEAFKQFRNSILVIRTDLSEYHKALVEMQLLKPKELTLYLSMPNMYYNELSCY